MMDDQLKHYQELLTEQGYSVNVVEPNSLAIQFCIDEKAIDVVCEIPKHFPYRFPIIRLTEKSADLCQDIPHRYVDDTICLFNSADARPHFLNPDQLFLASVKKAESIISEGLRCNNSEDFQKEYLEYWNRNAIIEFRSFAGFPDCICRLKSRYIKEGEHSGYIIIAEGKQHLETLSKKLFHAISTNSPPRHVLYIPLSKGFPSHVVRTEKDMWSMIAAGTNAAQRKRIQKEMRLMNNDCMLFVVSIPEEGGSRAYFGWISSGIQNIPGFRRNSISPFVYWAMKRTTDLPRIHAARVTQCSQEYLFYRGSYGFERRFRSAAIIGCGSVGGELALQLASMGTDSFLLIDKDILTADNIARHVCGCDYIGILKPYGVQLLLQRWNPNISCESLVSDAFDVLDGELDKINAMNCLFVAAGDMALEAYIMRMAEKGKIRIPIVFAWVEPRCYACHMVYVNKPVGVFEALVDADALTYKDSVIKETSFVEHVPGCQDGFIPYSGLDVKQFLSRCLHELTCITLDPKIKGNYHMIWVGELSEARRQKVSVNNEFSETPDFTLILKRFD